jgi:hypothetical protein
MRPQLWSIWRPIWFGACASTSSVSWDSLNTGCITSNKVQSRAMQQADGQQNWLLSACGRNCGVYGDRSGVKLMPAPAQSAGTNSPNTGCRGGNSSHQAQQKSNAPRGQTTVADVSQCMRPQSWGIRRPLYSVTACTRTLCTVAAQAQAPTRHLV